MRRRGWVPTATEADLPTEQLPAVAPIAASAAEHSPVPGSEAPGGHDAGPPHLRLLHLDDLGRGRERARGAYVFNSCPYESRGAAIYSTVAVLAVLGSGVGCCAVARFGGGRVEPISPSVNKYGVAIAASQRPDCAATAGKPTSRACVISLSGPVPTGAARPGSPAPCRPPDHLPALTDPGVVDRAVTRPVPASPAGSGRVAPQAHSDHCWVVVLVGAAVALGMWWFFIRGGQPGMPRRFSPAGSSAASPTPTASRRRRARQPGPSATNTHALPEPRAAAVV